MSDGEAGNSVPVSLARRRDPRPVELDGAATACHAPAKNLQFLPDGTIRACSQSLWPIGYVQTNHLHEAWIGFRREELVNRLAIGDMSRGCETCSAEFRAIGRPNSFAAQFDYLEGRGVPNWPARLEFSLSEECNLECVHCYGAVQELRRHVPDSSKFGDRFLNDLEPFLMNATEAVFGGGEPFVIEANYRVWELIAAVAPGLPCTIVTNGTQWTPRIEELLNRLRAGFVVSVDGATATTFEAIRVNASWKSVRANLQQFRSHAEHHGTWMSINFVLMAQNHHELGLMAELADDLDVDLSVVLARHPADCAIGQQTANYRRAIAEDLREQLLRHGPRLERNRTVLAQAVADAVATCDTHVDPDQLVRDLHRILLFARAGDGRHDDRPTRAQLTALSFDGVVHEVRVGSGDVVTTASPAVSVWCDDLVGRPAEHLQQVINEQLGSPIGQQILLQHDDQMDLESTHPGGVVRTSLVAMRDEQGLLTEVRILFCRTTSTR